MEPLPADAHILRDLALLYLALAHGTDQDLDHAEMDLIARRLLDAEAGVSQGTVLRALKEALEVYVREDVQAHIARAVEHLRQAAPPRLRRRILSDLSEIARADGKVLYAEAAFIGELAFAWKTDEPETPADTWSLFTDGEDQGWTPLHDLAFIYVTLAHRTDDTLSRREVEAITEKIGEWMPDANASTLRRLLHDVLTVYDEAPEGRTFEDAVAAVRQAVPAHQRAAVLDDLRFVADADGVMLVEERVLIEELARAWDAE